MNGIYKLIYSEAGIRLIFFFFVISIMAIWEILRPKRQLIENKIRRWKKNLLIIIIDSITLKLVFPVTLVSIAAGAEAAHWGLLNHFEISRPVAFIMGFLAMDLSIYLQHLMFHAVPILWRLHMVHHADMDIDVTTGLRFHPLEMILSLAIKMATISAIGPPPLAVLAFEVALNASSLFNHGNVNIAEKIDKYLRLFVVTPDMHRVHHSVIIRETNSNFGFNFPWWDRIFGTYRAQPIMGHEQITIGLSHIRYESTLGILGVLALPFTGDQGPYPINRSGADPRLLKKS
ncbi:putative sterol desaturase [Dissulfuribacter thermophilus]|uniref:Putative sterol desaturase n=1 Tax=Dissulfuribacter thermophilus TaxID=1156395 RepID=A0A1B9F7E5_9BACT|nr:sterol desaturase family protein [Dissulfuribacter thermophilus]OCC15857.1 putative sterol desaturase [Dissulfuribacter thermophilus]